MTALLDTWIPLLLIGSAIAFWSDALRARERAVAHCRALCREADVQLLDQSVALRRLGFARRDGRLAFRRQYIFEISHDGRDRHRGHLSLVGGELESYSLPSVDRAPVLRIVT